MLSVNELMLIFGKSCFVSLCVALAVWIIDGYHIGFGWFVVLQLLIALFLIVVQFTINDAETPKK